MKSVFLLCSLSLFAGPLVGQTRLHVRHPASDVQYFQQQLDLVDWVQDRQSADIAVDVFQDRLGSGVWRTQTIFYGAVSDTLETTLQADATSGQRRDSVLRLLQAGLATVLVQQDLPIQFTTKALQGQATQVEERQDPWKSWVFTTSGRTIGDGQATRSNRRWDAAFSANQTTQARVLNLRGRLKRNISSVDLPDGSTFESTTRSGSVNADVILTTGSHSGVGLRAGWSQSTFDNQEDSFTGDLIAEYNLFPYTESRQRHVRLAYRVRLKNYNYVDETIFGETNENVMSHLVSVNAWFVQQWGTMNASLSAEQHLTNFDRSLVDSYNVGGSFFASLRLFKGFSIVPSISARRLRDQFYLPVTSATEEEILTNTVSLPTGWNYFYQLTLSYRFGSIFNKAVNSRLGF